MSKKNIATILILTLIALVFQNCNPQKKIIKEPIKKQGADYLIDKIKKNEFTFNWLDVKFSAEFSVDGKKNNFKGALRIKKDSAIWVSISPLLGIEAFRMLITPDSLKLMNRIEKKYKTANFSYINNLLKTNFDFDIIQALILGNDLTCYENDKFKTHLNEKKYLLTTIGRRKIKKFLNKNDKERIVLQDIWVDPETYKIEKISLKEIKKNNKVNAYYSGFKAVDNMIYPTILYFDFNNKKVVQIKINFSKIELNNKKNISFKIPSKYTNF